MYYGLKHKNHNGNDVRKCGNWRKYHKYCLQNGYAKIIDGEFVFIEKKIGRNEKCPCGSNKKYKKCCLNKMKGT